MSGFARLAATLIAGLAASCSPVHDTHHPAAEAPAETAAARLAPGFRLDASNTHNKFSRAIPPVLTVPSGSVIEMLTKEATDGQLSVDSTAADLLTLDFEPIHPLTGPVYIEGAEPGDVLAVTLHEVELGSWGWNAHMPGFGFLASDFDEPYLKTWAFEPGQTHAEFEPGVVIPLNPFPGVIGVAPDTDEMLNTIPPRANGGNMDNRYMTAGTTVYLPVFVEGALLSVGDTHAAQGDGEVCGTAIEAPMRVVLEAHVVKGKLIQEPQYETDDFYAVTGFATTIDEAAQKATRYMLDYLEGERGMAREDAYALASLAGDLKISEAVDMPHFLVSMHMPKTIFEARAE
jgi:acetamidase/formamidase